MGLVAIEWTARCLRCDWTVAGDGAPAAAETHTKRETHATVQTALVLPRNG